jgi:malate synthase
MSFLFIKFPSTNAFTNLETMYPWTTSGITTSRLSPFCVHDESHDINTWRKLTDTLVTPISLSNNVYTDNLETGVESTKETIFFYKITKHYLKGTGQICANLITYHNVTETIDNKNR